MNSIEIVPDVYWVGSIDWDIRDFHGYETHRGSSYNAYLVIDEKIALVDSVKEGFGEDLLQKISERVEPSRIDYIICNHAEPDHSHEIGRVVEAAPHAKVVTNEKCISFLQKYYGGNWNFHPVKTGDSLSLGKYSLNFINTPMLHWPESMFTYLPEAKLLFSMDAFGQHYATGKRFDDELDYAELMYEARNYYANIVMHLGSIIKKTLQQTAEMEIELICPSHGAIWRSHIGDIIEAYQGWCRDKVRSKVLVIFETMWHSTEIMAETIAQAVTEAGVEVKRLRLNVNELTMLATEVLDAAVIAVGSPTLNNQMMPDVAAFLTYIKGLKPKNRVGLAFGSHGWSGGGAVQVHEIMDKMGIRMLSEPLVCQFRPDDTVLESCRKIGKVLAEHARQV